MPGDALISIVGLVLTECGKAHVAPVEVTLTSGRLWVPEICWQFRLTDSTLCQMRQL